MTPAQLRAELDRLGLTKADFARLVSDLSGQPYYDMTIWRWTKKGKEGRAVPALAVAFLKAWGEVPKVRRERLLNPE
jgi:hypothetical protein